MAASRQLLRAPLGSQTCTSSCMKVFLVAIQVSIYWDERSLDFKLTPVLPHQGQLEIRAELT